MGKITLLFAKTRKEQFFRELSESSDETLDNVMLQSRDSITDEEESDEEKRSCIAETIAAVDRTKVRRPLAIAPKLKAVNDTAIDTFETNKVKEVEEPPRKASLRMATLEKIPGNQRVTWASQKSTVPVGWVKRPHRHRASTANLNATIPVQ
ncbi:hypothetical protein D918_00309 [Trichuris suis]|nr:hypothetical protein D918_00309 [Trichuris suis]